MLRHRGVVLLLVLLNDGRRGGRRYLIGRAEVGCGVLGKQSEGGVGLVEGDADVMYALRSPGRLG